jgi:hypothetical protein
LARLGVAISLSTHTARVVKTALGEDFPIFAIASPVWDRIARQTLRTGGGAVIPDCEVRIAGTVIDTADYALTPEISLGPDFPPRPIDRTAAKDTPEIAATLVTPEPVLADPTGWEAPVRSVPVESRRPGLRYRLAVTKRHALEWYREAVRDLLPDWLSRLVGRTGGLVELLYRRLTGWTPPPPPPTPVPPPTPIVPVRLGGVVYTSMLNPTDGRKNWQDILTAFCWAFRDVEDATLVLKMVKGDSESYRRDLFLVLARLSPFKCRVVTMDGFLEDADYRMLIESSSYYVNASNAEGLCMPLMEFMSAGRPVIAPRHTAMEDYIDDSAAFIVGWTLEQNVWPNDPRQLYATMRHRPKWDTLVAAFEQSYAVAKDAPRRYALMGESAANIMRNYCSDAVVEGQLRTVMSKAVELAVLREAEAAGRSETSTEATPVQTPHVPEFETT